MSESEWIRGITRFGLSLFSLSKFELFPFVFIDIWWWLLFIGLWGCSFLVDSLRSLKTPIQIYNRNIYDMIIILYLKLYWLFLTCINWISSEKTGFRCIHFRRSGCLTWCSEISWARTRFRYVSCRSDSYSNKNNDV